METPFFGGSYTSLSPNLADSLCMNLYPELVETKEGKQIGAFYSTPGQRFLQTLANSGAGYVAGPMRGIHTAANHMLVAVFGNQVVQIDQNQNVTPLGHLNTASGPVSIIDNGSQYAVFDYFQGWSWSGSAWAQITTIPSFPGTATQQDGFGVVGINGTNQFYQSNLDDLTTWNALNFSSADSDSSNLVAVISLYRQLWLLKEKSIEIWNNAGLSGFVFQRMEGAYVNVGCAAPASVAISEDNVFWVGQSDKGSLVVYRNNGYAEARISTHAVEYAMQGYLGLSSIGIADAIGFCYTQAGHTFYVLTFPAANATHVYDATTKLWSQRGEWINGSYQRWDPSCYAYFAKNHIVGSSSAQQLSTLDILYPTDDLGSLLTTNPKRWARRFRALPRPVNKTVRFPSLRVDMQTGMPLTYPDQIGQRQSTIPILQISGSLGNANYNAVANFAYTINSTFTVKNVAVTSGALPTGLSMNSSGVITGTYAAQGTFSWQVTATNIFGDTVTISDSSTVSYALKGLWALLASGRGSSVWFGPSPAAFPVSASFSNAMLPSASDLQIQWTGVDMIYAGGTSSAQLSTSANQTFTSTITNTIQTTTTSGVLIRYASGVLFQCVSYTGSATLGSFQYSSNNGSTWQTGTIPANTYLRSVVRLKNGTWVSVCSNGSSQYLCYSTQAIPSSWTIGFTIPRGTILAYLGYDDATVMCISNWPDTFISTDGINWTTLATYPEANTSYDTFSIVGGATGQFVTQSKTNGCVWVSSNTGASWTKKTVSTAPGLTNNIGYGNGMFYATFAGITQSVVYSSDGGSTWHVGTLPAGFPALSNPTVGYL